MLTCCFDKISNKEILSHTVSLIDKHCDSNDTFYKSEMSLDKIVVNVAVFVGDPVI